jgi:hypothetical protein
LLVVLVHSTAAETPTEDVHGSINWPNLSGSSLRPASRFPRGLRLSTFHNYS